MKVIIAGSRKITNYKHVHFAVPQSPVYDLITEIISGKARGIDHLGEAYAEVHGIPVKPFPADWHYYGRAAGRVRNGEMGRHADFLIAIWDGVSVGTKHMVNYMKEIGKGVFIYCPK